MLKVIGKENNCYVLWQEGGFPVRWDQINMSKCESEHKHPHFNPLLLKQKLSVKNITKDIQGKYIEAKEIQTKNLQAKILQAKNIQAKGIEMKGIESKYL